MSDAPTNEASREVLDLELGVRPADPPTANGGYWRIRREEARPLPGNHRPGSG